VSGLCGAGSVRAARRGLQCKEVGVPLLQKVQFVLLG
jgi:hypothetical protein